MHDLYCSPLYVEKTTEAIKNFKVNEDKDFKFLGNIYGLHGRVHVMMVSSSIKSLILKPNSWEGKIFPQTP